MNIEALLKEREGLQRQQHNPSHNKTIPYIMSQESLESMVKLSAAAYIQQNPPGEENKTSSFPMQASMSVEMDDISSHSSNGGDQQERLSTASSISSRDNSFDDNKSDGAVSQQTSVITSVRRRSTEKTRLKSFQRQKSVDETMHGAETATINNSSTRNNTDRNNNTTERKHKPVTPHSIVSFLDDSDESKKGKVPRFLSQQEPQYERYNKNVTTTPQKSKSLDAVKAESDYHRYGYPVRFPKYPPFDMEEQTAHYINALHISPPAPHLYGHSSFPNSPCGSPIDTSIRLSPGAGNAGPLRRLQQQERHLQDGPIIHGQAPITFSNSKQRGEQFTKSRSYETQGQRQHRFSQKKAYSLATAPYDVHEKHLRRILSEENLPENLIINKSLNKYPSMRRAASYDLIKSPSRGNSPTRLTSDSSYLRQQAVVKSTKIMFPEHDNVTDCNSIFTQPIEDERAHALKINKIMERSFTDPPTLYHAQKHSHSFDELDSKNAERSFTMTDITNPLFINNKNILQNTPSFEELERTNKKNENASKQTKTLVQQSSTDKSHPIGPYQYDPEIDNEIAVCVSGLLTLPGSNEKKYPISVGELRRRIAPPEFLNKVDMISYVRLAKTTARELLDKHAIRPKHHCRKSKHSVISKMCEAECTELANGMKMLSDIYFPKEWLANEVVNSVQNESETSKQQKLAEIQKRFEIAKDVLKDISTLIDTKKQCEEMQNYNLATHSFGALNLSNNIELLTSYIQTQSDVINKKLVNTDYRTRENDSMETESEPESSRNNSVDDSQSLK